MNQNRFNYYLDSVATDRFLFSKQDSENKCSMEKGGIGVEKSVDLSEYYDEIYTNTIIRDALNNIPVSVQFSIMAIGIDVELKESSPSDSHGTGHLSNTVFKIINSLSESKKKFIAKISDHLFALIIPLKTGSDFIRLAENIRSQISIECHHTVSIGIAHYPYKNFTRKAVMQNAVKALDHASFFGPNSAVEFDAVSLNISGDRYYQSGNIDRAVKEFQTAISISPKNINVHNSLGVCFAVLKQYKKAIREFDTSLKLNRKEMMPHFNIGLCLYLQNKKQKALTHFLLMKDMGFKHFELYFQIGRIYYECNEYSKAIPYLEKAGESHSESVPSFKLLGKSFYKLNMDKEAIWAFKRVVKLNPNDAEPLSMLGYLYDKRDENPEISIIFCQQSIDISPNNGLFRHRLGTIYLKQNKLDLALLEFQKASELGYQSKPQIKEIQNRLTAKVS